MSKGIPKGRVYVWMYVTGDRYALPIVTADSSRELAEKCGVKQNTINHHISQHKSGRAKGEPRYLCIKLTEEDVDGEAEDGQTADGKDPGDV